MSAYSDKKSDFKPLITYMRIVFISMAAYCSWSVNHSILWAAFHGAFGLLYIIYLLLGFGGGMPELPW
jgi:hypothetical protein